MVKASNITCNQSCCDKGRWLHLLPWLLALHHGIHLRDKSSYLVRKTNLPGIRDVLVSAQQFVHISCGSILDFNQHMVHVHAVCACVERGRQLSRRSRVALSKSLDFDTQASRESLVSWWTSVNNLYPILSLVPGVRHLRRHLFETTLPTSCWRISCCCQWVN